MSASSSNFPSKSTTRESSHKRKKSEEANIQRKRPSIASRLQPVHLVPNDVRDAQSREIEDGIDPEPPSMNRGDGDVQNREDRDGGILDFAISTNARSIAAKEPKSVNRGDVVVQRGEAPSMSTPQGASNASNQVLPAQNPWVNTGGGAHFQTTHFTGGGHAFGTNSYVYNMTFTNIRSGDGQFTKHERDFVRRSYTSLVKG
ncbi:hypothetical protein M378DRAFT_640011 [Amanita muscaria Koide BX008]|uniref:Uncharacterized protein n=1 Tax=Amanita muscaria (strain Koide BX008) TaxID=946122 RepID=A0A0C2WGQ9_AMAMK|nr:hypothetical protein M378DRAFT_640011 [Amanita muscaria Koide BX008]